MESLARDLRYALRGLRQNPGFAAIAVFTLALGIGATTAAYSVIATSLTARIPVRQIERVVGIWSFDRTNGQSRVVVSTADFVAWQERQRSFEGLTAERFDSVNLSGIDQPVRASAGFVSASHFDVLGVHPLMGRAFSPEENQPGGARVAILNSRSWRDRFEARPDVIGRTVVIDGRTTTIVGVMPPDDYTPDILLPLTIDAASPSYSQRALLVAARLKPDVTFEQARAEMDAIGAQLAREQPETHRGWGISIHPYQDEFLASGEKVVFALLGLAAFAVLLIGCANIANLLLARGNARARELAIRAALGASHLRLIRQMLAESAVLAAVGGALGLVFAYAGLHLLLTTFFSSGLPAFVAERSFMDASVLACAIGASVCSALFFGVLPAFQHARGARLTPGDGERSTEGWAARRLRSVLVSGQVAAAVVLLVTATLFLRTVVNFRGVEPGFDTRNLLLMEVALPETAYVTATSAAFFYDRVLERLAVSPGVVAAGAAERVPVEGSYLNPSRTIQIEGRPALNGQTRTVDDIGVTAGYLETLRVPLRAGRLFTSGDGAAVPLVVVISETAARRYWGQESPLGARLRLGDEPSSDAWRTVIGIVGDIRNDDIDMPPPAYVYVPAAQRPTREMTIMLRTSDDPLSHVAASRAAIAAEDPNLPVYDIQSMDQLLAVDLRGPAVLSSMTGVFAGLALMLAAVGIYGMVAYTVAQRTRELALRIAIGAQRRDVIRHILTGGLGAVLAGLLLGLAGSIAVSQLMTVVLYGVSPTDPMSYALVTVVLVGSALLACIVPAQRALRLDPVVALRHE